MSKTLEIILGSVLAAVIVAVLVIWGVSNNSAPLPAATSVLASDGYTPTTAFPQVPPAVEADYGSGISSWAIGTRGNDLEMVLVGSNAAANLSHVQSFIGGSISVTASGSVMRVSGPQLAFEGSVW